MSKILDGKKVSEKILRKLARRVRQRKRSLTLAALLVGSHAASESYVAKKQEVCARCGIEFQCLRLPSSVSASRLKKEVSLLGKDPAVSGIIVQLPLPSRMRVQEVLDEIPLRKDVDCLSSAAAAEILAGRFPASPPVAKAVDHLLKEYKISLKGKHVVVVGQGRLVGRPLALALLSQRIPFTSLNKETKEVRRFTKEADVLISGTGKAGSLTKGMVKKGAVVIDAGTSGEKGVVKGDVNFRSVLQKAYAVTPVPGGVGPLAVACLLENLLALNEK